ncbi:long-chain-fatty-acid--CoA ligase [Dictyobacter kobayashii]|uniref:Long-chain-fatty-acid--CoA ligase n=1 Tax=Dictyobacter kobayashii TaxID=2014872 RepID=A0A402AJT6_9CHLR|nr:long-chain fatty acid--CoA ligase [Dictyobacter kobayashii]GCE19324.1 long-chain-fatty-acid--CoA ligase [Dictyobacter kobayashii]
MSDPSLIHNTQAEQHSIERTKEENSFPWFRHYDHGVPTHLDIPERPLTSLLDNAAKRYPNQAAFVYYGNKITYAQFSNQANRFAIELQRLGVQKGDRVAIALPNIPQFPIAFYGALRAGAVAVPTNPLYTEREMQHQLADSGAKVLIVLDMYYPIIRNIRNQTALEHVIVTSPADFLPPLLQKLYPLSQKNNKLPQPALTRKEVESDPILHTMQPMLQSHAKGGIELFNLPVHVQSDDLAVLQYTGGTTGLSKGAMLTHRNLLANAMQTRYWVPKAKDAAETSLCVAPFFHAYGLSVGMNLSILAAATMILLPQFKAKDVLDAIHHYHPTMFPGIPTMYVAIMKEAGKHTEYLESIKYCISGASPLPAKIQTDFETITGGKLVEGYGLSEAAPVTHCNPLSDKSRNGSIGLPLPSVEATILDRTTSEPLPVGEVGELVVKGPNVMKGYWKREEETQALFVNGWMRTGDIGKMDEDGYFYVVERAKDMIIASGFNVYPREVEEVLYHHPAIAEVAVAGVPDAYRGETVAAFIVLKPEFKPSEQLEQDIVAFCKQKLTAYKVPKRIEFRDNLPKSLVGKVLRRELRKQL